MVDERVAVGAFTMGRTSTGIRMSCRIALSIVSLPRSASSGNALSSDQVVKLQFRIRAYDLVNQICG